MLIAMLGGCKIYQSIGKSTGAFLWPVHGNKFAHISNSQWSSKTNGLIYFYRPHSDWAAEELEAPSVYVDDSHYFNLRNNGYTWLEVRPGKRHIAMRRPLFGLEGLNSFSLSEIANAELEIEAGKVYYLRYSEVSKPKLLNPDLDPDSPWGQGDLQLVQSDVAYPEIVETRFLKSDLLAPNHAGTSIVHDNVESDFARREQEIEEARETELAQLKGSGAYNPGAWWCLYLCGGDSLPELKADRMAAELERDRAAYEKSLEPKVEVVAEQQEESSGWWPF